MASYAAPAITASGLSINTYQAILNYLVSAYLGIYGQNVYLGPDGADFQDIAVRALQNSDVQNALAIVYAAFNPLTAIGTSLDLLGILIGTPRKAATFSTALVTVTGTAYTTINNGVIQDTTGNYWNLPALVTIGFGGTVNVTATAQNIGNITANAGVISIISTPTAGWTGVTNPAAASPGQPVETDSAYRARLIISQALPSLTTLAGTAAGIAAVAGVTRSQIYENPTGSTDSNGNPPHSITAVVEGGSAQAIAQAIYNNKGIGSLTNGLVSGVSVPQTTTITITDPNNGGLSQSISFLVLGYLPIYVAMSVHALTGYTSATTTAIQAAIVAYLNGLGIGEEVVYSSIYGAALSVMPDPSIPEFSIRSLTTGYAANQTTATTTAFNAVITVASAIGIAGGQLVIGAGIPTGTTVLSIAGLNVTLSANCSVSASNVPVVFFQNGTSDIAVAFELASSSLASNVVLTLV